MAVANFLHPKSDGPHFGFREKWRRSGDALLVFEREEDARRVLDVLPKRFARYGLTWHPEKDRTGGLSSSIPARRTGLATRAQLDRLGFTYDWGRFRKGRWVVHRKTAKARFSRAVWQIEHWCGRNRHQPVAEQPWALSCKLRGHDVYSGITGNARARSRFRHEAEQR